MQIIFSTSYSKYRSLTWVPGNPEKSNRIGFALVAASKKSVVHVYKFSSYPRSMVIKLKYVEIGQNCANLVEIS